LGATSSHNNLLPHLFRQEYAKMTAVICRHFGLNHIAVAEDIASDTFLKASEHWALNGIPENPVAWLYAVAKNKAKDYLRHLHVVQNHSERNNSLVEEPAIDVEIDERIIRDSQLAMIFAVCNPAIPPEGQICLALQVLCGFSLQEISNAFLTNRETIKKRLQRARQHLRNNEFSLEHLSEKHIASRLDTVLKTIYLLFNEGYFSETHPSAIRKDLCSEAVRLALILTENSLTCTPKVNALLALMCFQISRLEARINAEGKTVLFEEQDRKMWDQQMINLGNYYLIAATEGNDISKYHLEAGIAYWHTTEDKNKWQHILRLYNQLILIEYSPMTALSRAFAISKVYGNSEAISEVEKLQLDSIYHYYALLGYLHSTIDKKKAIENYEKAISLTTSPAAKQRLTEEMARLQ
jgi:RNA polymerase sigma factor (sigma-70 family)